MRPDSIYKNWIRCTIAVVVGFFFLASSRLEARQKHKAQLAQKHKVHRNIKSNDQPVKRRYTHHSAHKATRHHYTHRQNTGRHRRRHHYHYHSRHHHRFRLVRLQPQRVKEIQQALVNAGYLQGAPTGKWDASTRDAMERYQQANGFKPTGLPEAKPLMKLGLGPHPLPPGVEPLSAKSSSMRGETEASTSPDTSTPARVSSQTQ